MAAWFRLTLSPDEQVRVQNDRRPDPVVRRKALVHWTVHLGHSGEQAAKIACGGVATAKRDILAYCDGGVDGLERCGRHVPTSAHADAIQRSFTEHSVRTVAEAAERIRQLTGLQRGLTQTRAFRPTLRFTWQRSRAVPIAPKKIADRTPHRVRRKASSSTRSRPPHSRVFFASSTCFLTGNAISARCRSVQTSSDCAVEALTTTVRRAK